MNLFVFGLGYSAGHYARHHAAEFSRIVGTVRTQGKAEELAHEGVDTVVFDGFDADPRLPSALAQADAILVSVQPSDGQDAALDRFGQLIEASPAGRIVYLSTIGVYGDHDGRWIDETVTAEPESARGRERLAIEQSWLELGARARKQVSVLRLAGIYGPGRNVLDDLRAGQARRIDKPGQVFNRIHVEDIGRTIAAAFRSGAAHGVWNVTDDEPAPAPDVVAYGAALLGMAPPPLLAFETVELSAMARSFYGANRRVSNTAIKTRLGVQLSYPTYREGLQGLLAGTDG